MTNQGIAAFFTELADIMEIAGEDHFKVRAYRNAAATIAANPESIEDMPPEKIRDIPGIGKAISEKIASIKTSGTFPTLEKWRQSEFASFRPLLEIPGGLGIRKLRTLIKNHNLASLAELKKAISERIIDENALGAETITFLRGL